MKFWLFFAAVVGTLWGIVAGLALHSFGAGLTVAIAAVLACIFAGGLCAASAHGGASLNIWKDDKDERL